jgi:branched-chain amino acid transport system substrate-binding protein
MGNLTSYAGAYRKGLIVAAAVTPMALAFLVGCSSSGGSSSVSGSASSLGTPFVIGSVSDVTGPQASSEGGINRALSAWASWTNAQGGIDGHAVKMIALDTGANPTTGLTEVKQLVQQDHIIALVGALSNLDGTWAPYLQQNKIPMIGDTLTGVLDQYSDYFPEGTSVSASFALEALAGKMSGDTKEGFLYCSEVAACSSAVPTVKGGAESEDVSLSYSGAVSSSAPNYLAPCLAAKHAGVNTLGVFEGSSTVINVESSCHSQGYNPLFIEVGGAPTENWATTPTMNGTEMVLSDAPFFDFSSPGGAVMKEALDKYAPGLIGSSLYGPNIVYAWTSAELFAAAATAAHLGSDPTAAKVIQGLYDLKGATLDGMAPPLTFNPGKPNLIKCGFIGAVKDGSFATPYGTKTFCAA